MLHLSSAKTMCMCEALSDFVSLVELPELVSYDRRNLKLFACCKSSLPILH